jgi:hypothetical protein
MASAWVVVIAVRQPGLATLTQKRATKAGDVTGTSHSGDIQRQLGQYKMGVTMATSGPFEFAKYKRPRFEGPTHMTHDRAALAESGGGEMPTENLGDLLDRVTNNSAGEINSLIGEFERLRAKLQTDGERIKREIEDYKALSQQVMELTKTISGSVEKVRASADRPTLVT